MTRARVPGSGAGRTASDQIDWRAQKVSSQPARDDSYAAPLLQGERFARVGVFGRDFGSPSLDSLEAGAGPAFIFDYGVVRKASRDGLAVEFVGGEVRGDQLGEIEALVHGGLHRS